MPWNESQTFFKRPITSNEQLKIERNKLDFGTLAPAREPCGRTGGKDTTSQQVRKEHIDNMVEQWTKELNSFMRYK